MQGSAPRWKAATLSECVRGATKADQQAFAELFTRYRRFALSVARSFTDGHHPAEDAAIDGFAAAFKAIGSLKDPQSFPSYLATCVRNEALKVARGHDRALPIGEELIDRLVAVETPESHTERSEEIGRVQAALLGLDHRQREAITLVEVDGLAPREVAARLQITLNALYQLLYRARQSLQLRFVAPPIDEDAPADCRACNDKLGMYLAGRASTRTANMIEEHILGCPECCVRLAGAREVHQAVRPSYGLGLLVFWLRDRLGRPALKRSGFHPIGRATRSRHLRGLRWPHPVCGASGPSRVLALRGARCLGGVGPGGATAGLSTALTAPAVAAAVAISAVLVLTSTPHGLPDMPAVAIPTLNNGLSRANAAPMDASTDGSAASPQATALGSSKVVLPFSPPVVVSTQDHRPSAVSGPSEPAPRLITSSVPSIPSVPSVHAEISSPSVPVTAHAPVTAPTSDGAPTSGTAPTGVGSSTSVVTLNTTTTTTEPVVGSGRPATSTTQDRHRESPSSHGQGSTGDPAELGRDAGS